MVSNIKDSLFVRALLDNEINLEDHTQIGSELKGDINRNALINRVKKLDDHVRLELVYDLDRILTELGTTTNTMRPLNERGLCVMLLTDDGTQAQSRGFFGTIYQIFRNLFGYSYSSDTIISKITEVQELLLKKSLQRPKNSLTPDEMKEALTKKVQSQKAKFEARFSKVGDRKESTNIIQFEDLRSKLNNLQMMMSQCPSRLATNEMADIITHINYIYNDLLNNEVYKNVEDRLVADTGRTLTQISLLNQNSFVPLVIDFKNEREYITDDENLVLSDLENRASDAEFALSDTCFLNKTVLSIARKKILDSMLSIREEVKLENRKIIIKSNRIKLINSRLKKLEDYRRAHIKMAEDNQLANIASSNAAQAKVEINLLNQKINEILHDLNTVNRVCSSVDSLISKCESNVELTKLNAYVSIFVDLVCRSSDYDMKICHSYSDKLRIFRDVLKGDALTINELKQSINLDKYLPLRFTDATQRVMCENLSPLFEKNESFFLENVEERKTLAIAYLKYLKFVYSAEKTILENEIALKQNHIELLKSTPPLDLATPNPSPEMTLQRATVTIAPQDPKITLATYSQKLFLDLNNDCLVKEILAGLNSLPDSVVNDIHHNFYFIMQKFNKIKEGHDAWGRKVFEGQELDRLLTDTVDLNKFRAHAINMVSQGIKVSGENDSNLNFAV